MVLEKVLLSLYRLKTSFILESTFFDGLPEYTPLSNFPQLLLLFKWTFNGSESFRTLTGLLRLTESQTNKLCCTEQLNGCVGYWMTIFIFQDSTAETVILISPKFGVSQISSLRNTVVSIVRRPQFWHEMAWRLLLSILPEKENTFRESLP